MIIRLTNHTMRCISINSLVNIWISCVSGGNRCETFLRSLMATKWSILIKNIINWFHIRSSTASLPQCLWSTPFVGAAQRLGYCSANWVSRHGGINCTTLFCAEFFHRASPFWSSLKAVNRSGESIHSQHAWLVDSKAVCFWLCQTTANQPLNSQFYELVNN